MSVSPIGWAAFIALVAVLLLVDLLVLHRDAKEIAFKEAALYSAGWIALGLGFAAVIWVWGGGNAALAYLTGYVVEKALSVDNVFVFVMIFAYFAVPLAYQHRVLFWGIIGAVLLRGVFIVAGTALIHRFDWVTYVFGALLVITAGRLFFGSETEIHPDKNLTVRIARRLLPISRDYDGAKLGTRVDGRWMLTPLFVVLLVVDVADVVFAVDSIPAIFAITTDTFIVFTSNVFAILGLRALYFLLAGVMYKFRFLNVGLALTLLFVGVKMLIHRWWVVPTAASLGMIVLFIGGAIAASLGFPEAATTRCEQCGAESADEVCPDCGAELWPAKAPGN